ncbi:MAG: 30S ribosomal protein S4 [Thermoplasmata archaeon]|nr:30S ribosomal protein S4 [Thermoplasmata archaeon]
MGDPKFSRRRYETPAQPWEGERIKAENELLMKYGLKNKRELWRAQSMVRRLRATSRDLQARLRTGDPQAKVETAEILGKCSRMALLPSDGATLNDVLALNTETVLSRRLQTIVYRKGLAFTPKHARQLIVHGHASVGDRKVTIPGYLVKRGEEENISYSETSPLTDDIHPARPKADDVDRQRLEDGEREKAKEREQIDSKARFKSKRTITVAAEVPVTKAVAEAPVEEKQESKE